MCAPYTHMFWLGIPILEFRDLSYPFRCICLAPSICLLCNLRSKRSSIETTLMLMRAGAYTKINDGDASGNTAMHYGAMHADVLYVQVGKAQVHRHPLDATVDIP